MQADTEMVGGALCLDFSNHLNRLFKTDYKDNAENCSVILDWCVRAGGLSPEESKRLQILASKKGQDLEPFLSPGGSILPDPSPGLLPPWPETSPRIPRNYDV